MDNHNIVRGNIIGKAFELQSTSRAAERVRGGKIDGLTYATCGIVKERRSRSGIAGNGTGSTQGPGEGNTRPRLDE
jgi:hypothetical protein